MKGQTAKPRANKAAIAISRGRNIITTILKEMHLSNEGSSSRLNAPSFQRQSLITEAVLGVAGTQDRVSIYSAAYSLLLTEIQPVLATTK